MKYLIVLAAVIVAATAAPSEFQPACTTCTAAKAYPCARTISKKIIDLATAYLTSTTDSAETAWDAITNGTTYKQDTGFYVFVYKFSGICVAHGARADFVGMTLPQIVAFINNPSDGTATDNALQAGAEAGGGWVSYDWKNNADEDAYQKVAYSAKVTKWGEDYYVGVGFNLLSDTVTSPCATSGVSACAEANTMILMGKLQADLDIADTAGMNQIFTTVTNGTTYESEGFYAFIYDYAGPCVAHGARSDFVGLTLPEIVTLVSNPSDGQATDDALQAGAEASGGWVTYDWTNSADTTPYKKIAYVTGFSKGGSDYYVGIGFNNVCETGYTALATCANSPPPPLTGPGGCSNAATNTTTDATTNNDVSSATSATFGMAFLAFLLGLF